MLFSDQIFEAIILDISYDDGVCSISPLSTSLSSTIRNVPLPFFASNGNSGIFGGLQKGSRVLAVNTSLKGREATVIAGLIPKQNLYAKFFNLRKPDDTPNGVIAYPKLADGRLILRGDRGSSLSLMETGDLIATTLGGRGSHLKRNDNRAAHTLVAEDLSSYSSAGKHFSGPVRRINGLQRNLFPKPDLNEVPLFADPDFANKADSLGFFTGSAPLKRSFKQRKRNPEISEYRLVINEFSTDYMFTGFDDEVDRYTGSTGMFDNQETFARNREPGNTLHLAEHELVEIIGGNVVDLNGSVLDLNYRPLFYGVDDNRIPTSDITVSYDRARRISRRGIGYHFQVATNTKADDPSTSQSNFVFDVDKEGVLKVNVPASSNTGNIPFASAANFTADGDSVSVSYLNPSKTEPVPVFLRNENGEIVLPPKDAQGIDTRETGVRYNVSEDSPYFPTGSESSAIASVRVNSTKHHNMYAAAERLIANTIRMINIPQFFTNADGLPEGISVGKPFEILIPETLNQEENAVDFSAFREILGEGKSDFPSFMSVVAVSPGVPAIDPGGETLVAGINYDNEFDFPAFSNSFSSEVIGSEVVATNQDRQVGGKSAHFNLEGSLELSVGKDNFDQKSILLDTSGSLISWLGKDRNNRSMVMQMDGEVLINVGGTYDSPDAQNSDMNVGRFELRVNVVDKKFVATQFVNDIPENGGNPRADSDFVISISENGIVIAGMKSGAPMIFRNDGPILMESSSDTVSLKGMEIKMIEPKGRAKTLRSSGR